MSLWSGFSFLTPPLQIVHELCHAVMYSRRVEESILNTTPVETQIIPPDPVSV